MDSARTTISNLADKGVESLEFIKEVLATVCNITNEMMVYLSNMIGRLTVLGMIGLLFLAEKTSGQGEAEYQAEYAKRITMEMINGVYIPTDLEDAFSELSRLSDPKGVAEFQTAPEDSIRRRLHFGLGKWILINWSLEEGSRISHYLKQKGITAPDDMVEFIIVMWHRQLNGVPLKQEEEIANIQKRQAEEQKKRDEKKTVIILEKKPHKE